jgi:hypothetical protein
MRPEDSQFPVTGRLYQSWIKVYGKFIFLAKRQEKRVKWKGWRVKGEKE